MWTRPAGSPGESGCVSGCRGRAGRVSRVFVAQARRCCKSNPKRESQQRRLDRKSFAPVHLPGSDATGPAPPAPLPIRSSPPLLSPPPASTQIGPPSPPRSLCQLHRTPPGSRARPPANQRPLSSDRWGPQPIGTADPETRNEEEELAKPWRCDQHRRGVVTELNSSPGGRAPQ